MEMYVWFIHSPVNGHCQLLLLVPNAATNMHVQMSPNLPSSLLDKEPEVELLDHTVLPLSIF